MEQKQYTPDDEQRITKMAEHIRAIIELIGEDPAREGLVKTPVRAARALNYITSGYRQNPTELMSKAIFSYNGSRMVVVKDVEFYSLCEHHVLPFFGKMSVAYVPDGTMLGLSKVARVIDAYARRLQVQEHLTAQVCQEIFETLPAKGVIVKCTAAHLCMKMRGVEKQDSMTTTVDYCGVFADDAALRTEFFNALKD